MQLGQPLLSLLPGDGRLEAELLVPSRAIGFIEPGDSVGTMREAMVPSFCLYVELMQIRPLPPSELKAPRMKSSWPPVPEIWRVPDDSLEPA